MAEAELLDWSVPLSTGLAGDCFMISLGNGGEVPSLNSPVKVHKEFQALTMASSCGVSLSLPM